MTTNTKVRRAFTGDHVQQYDMKSQKANWLDPEIVFGLAYQDTAPGETILDVGIGTGLASVLFHKAGLRVKGMDFSSEMLEVCRKKALRLNSRSTMCLFRRIRLPMNRFTTPYAPESCTFSAIWT